MFLCDIRLGLVPNSRKDPKTKFDSTLHLHEALKGGFKGGLEGSFKRVSRGLEGGFKGA